MMRGSNPADVLCRVDIPSTREMTVEGGSRIPGKKSKSYTLYRIRCTAHVSRVGETAILLTSLLHPH